MKDERGGLNMTHQKNMNKYHVANINNFFITRGKILKKLYISNTAWNKSVASAICSLKENSGYIIKTMGDKWINSLIKELEEMTDPLHSDVILSNAYPKLKNEYVNCRLDVFGSVFLSEDPEFMPSHRKEWPLFEYFIVEPGTLSSLYKNNLVLLANPPDVNEQEKNIAGEKIDETTYGKTPMVSIRLKTKGLRRHENGALLLNWSFRGRLGAMAKIFVNGILDYPAFLVNSSDEDRTPNFWTVVPWFEECVIDLKHVGQGYLWFEHCDIHHVIWNE